MFRYYRLFKVKVPLLMVCRLILLLMSLTFTVPEIVPEMELPEMVPENTWLPPVPEPGSMSPERLKVLPVILPVTPVLDEIVMLLFVCTIANTSVSLLILTTGVL